jgi:hypothetical protein
MRKLCALCRRSKAKPSCWLDGKQGHGEEEECDAAKEANPEEETVTSKREDEQAPRGGRTGVTIGSKVNVLT